MKVHIEDIIVKGKVNGRLFLESDSMQFILKEYTGKVIIDPKGKEIPTYKTHGYFSTVAHALNHIIKMKVMESTAQTLGELQEEILRLREYFESNFDMSVRIERSGAEDDGR